MQGGAVTASSPGRGRGATFRIRLPLANASRPPQLVSGRPEPDARRKKGERRTEEPQRLDGLRILIVEDDPETLEMIKFAFDKRGAEVITAVSASEAMELLERRRPHPLISDIALPDQTHSDF